MAPVAAPEPPPLSPEHQARYEEMKQRYQKSLEERNARYEDLRRRAEEAGVTLPETPPWAKQPLPEPPGSLPGDVMPGGTEQPKAPSAVGQLPSPPPFPSAGAPSPEEREALREQQYQQMRERAKARGVDMPEVPPWKLGHATEEERREHREKMSDMTPEERRAYRQEMWSKMRERAREKGFEVPEPGSWQQPSPPTPWLSQAERERYQAILDQMTPEQKEAAQAIYGGPMPPRMAVPHGAQTAPQPSQAYGPQDYGGYGYGAPPAQGYGMPQRSRWGPAVPQSYGPSVPQVSPDYGQGFGTPQGYGQGYDMPRWYGSGYGMPGAAYGPSGYGPLQDYGPSYGPAGEMQRPPGGTPPAGTRY